MQQQRSVRPHDIFSVTISIVCPDLLVSFSLALRLSLLHFSVIFCQDILSPPLSHARAHEKHVDVGMIMSAEWTGLSSCSLCRSSSITVIKVTHRDLMMDRRKPHICPVDVKRLMQCLPCVWVHQLQFLGTMCAWDGLQLTWHLAFLITESTLTGVLMFKLESRKIALQWLVNLSKSFYMPLNLKLCRSTNKWDLFFF